MTAPPGGDAVVACADLCARMGATSFEVGYLDEDVPSVEARWYAHAQFRGSRVTAENHPGPEEACDSLAVRLLRGGRCTNCGRKTGVTVIHISRCTWSRDGDAWVRGCDGKRLATKRGPS